MDSNRLTAEKIIELKDFIIRDLLRGKQGKFTIIDDSTLMVSSNLLDSFMLVELAMFIEANFGISVPDYAMTPENIDTFDQLINFINKLIEES